MSGFDYNDTRKDGKIKCYFCGRWVKGYRDISKLVCLSCARKLEEVSEKLSKEVYKGGL